MTEISVNTQECLRWFGYSSIDSLPIADFVYRPRPHCQEICKTCASELQYKWAFRYNAVLGCILPSQPYPIDRLAALIKLDDYPSYEDFIGYLKKFSDGERLRLLRRATKGGYWVEEFPLALFTEDRFEIHHSKETRQGRQIDGNLAVTVDDMDNPANRLGIFTGSTCRKFLQRAFGVFLAAPGHMQGRILVDKKLIAYIVVYRTGNVASYIWIVGDAAHLRYGVMDFCHHHIMKMLLDGKPEWAKGVEFLRYAGMEDGLAGLFHWKRRAGFRPYRLYETPDEVDCGVFEPDGEPSRAGDATERRETVR